MIKGVDLDDVMMGRDRVKVGPLILRHPGISVVVPSGTLCET